MIEAVDWEGANVDIRKEFGACDDGRISIHPYLSGRLIGEACQVVYYDHVQGEVADFVTVREAGDLIQVSLYHCKGSGASKSGQRVGDVYEVTCQAIKSLNRLLRKGVLLKHIERRSQGKPERFRKGTLDTARASLRRTSQVRTEYEIVIVQPGISATGVDPDSERVLASCAEYVRKIRGTRLRIMTSP